VCEKEGGEKKGSACEEKCASEPNPKLMITGVRLLQWHHHSPCPRAASVSYPTRTPPPRHTVRGTLAWAACFTVGTGASFFLLVFILVEAVGPRCSELDEFAQLLQG
jgi:hypothetical protein